MSVVDVPPVLPNALSATKPGAMVCVLEDGLMGTRWYGPFQLACPVLYTPPLQARSVVRGGEYNWESLDGQVFGALPPEPLVTMQRKQEATPDPSAVSISAASRCRMSATRSMRSS